MAQDVDKSRIANATTEPEEHEEIEVTAEMIEAGREEVYAHITGLLTATDSTEAEAAAVDIFRAMIRARVDRL
jgi:hypothetical protein